MPPPALVEDGDEAARVDVEIAVEPGAPDPDRPRLPIRTPDRPAGGRRAGVADRRDGATVGQHGVALPLEPFRAAEAGPSLRRHRRQVSPDRRLGRTFVWPAGLSAPPLSIP